MQQDAKLPNILTFIWHSHSKLLFAFLIVHILNEATSAQYKQCNEAYITTANINHLPQVMHGKQLGLTPVGRKLFIRTSQGIQIMKPFLKMNLSSRTFCEQEEKNA